MFKAIANKSKDIALQFVASWIVNKYHLNRLGRMTALQLDSTKQEIYIALDLHGEQSTVELTVRYRVVSPTLIEITGVDSSREWIATLVNDMVPVEQKRIEVPKAVTTALSSLIK